MSTTYSFGCKECKEKVWAGQSDYLYGYSYIANFLHKHLNHELVFFNDLADDEELGEYSDYEDTLEKKDD